MTLSYSSVIVNLCRERKLDKLIRGQALNLTLYKAGNAARRPVRIQKPSQKRNDSDSWFISRNGKDARRIEPEKVQKIAVMENLLYYDTSYLQAAIEGGLTLVTDDEQLFGASMKHVENRRSDRYEPSSLLSRDEQS